VGALEKYCGLDFIYEAVTQARVLEPRFHFLHLAYLVYQALIDG